MNLSNNPQVADLAILFAACNDSAAGHCLWVNKQGDVFVDPIPESLSPVGFERSKSDMLLRYETFDCGNNYVGLNAAEDSKYVQRMFNSLVKEWANYSLTSTTEAFYIDHF